MRLVPNEVKRRRKFGVEKYGRDAIEEGLHVHPDFPSIARNRCPQTNCLALKLEITTLENGSTRHYCHTCGYLQIWKPHLSAVMEINGVNYRLVIQ